MTQIPAEIESVYAKIMSSNGVSNKHDEVPEGGIYMALKYRIPNNRLHLALWHIWRWCQLYFPFVLHIVGSVGSKTRWADNQFRKFSEQVIDGNAFAQKALENGAAFAIVDNPRKHRPPHTILVEDVSETLYALGRYHRQHIDIPVIGITGSVGKTTTTHLINAILSKKMITACKFGSNNAIANSMNLLNAPTDAEVIVLEMSAIRRGFLNAACDILRPTHGVITNTGLAHLDTFGSVENIQKGKWELFEKIIDSDGTVFLNTNHSWLASQAHRAEKAIRFGSQSGNHVVGNMLSADPLIKIRWHFKRDVNFIDIQTKLAGEHNLDNLLGAIAIGTHFGVPPTDIVDAIESFDPIEGRSQIFQWGSNVVYNEGYQCNAPSTVANLKSFASFSADRKMLILEQVGLIQPDHPVHQEIIDMVKEMQLDQVLIVGERYMRFKNQNVGTHFQTRAELRNWLEANPIRNTHLMLNTSGFLNIRGLLDEIPAN